MKPSYPCRKVPEMADEEAPEKLSGAGFKMTRMEPDELRELARDTHAGRVFFASDEDADLLPAIFMPIALGGLAGADPAEVELIGGIYEYLERAGTLGVNGRPMFTSVRFLHNDDVVELRRLVDTIQQAVDGALNDD